MLRGILIAFCLFVFQANAFEASPTIRKVRRDVEKRGLVALAERTDWTIKKIIERGTRKLEREGFHNEAEEIRSQFASFRNHLSSMVTTRRSIGDHDPFNEFLALAYETMETSLGVETCKALHLSDLKSINFGIPVVFYPKDFPMDAIEIPRIDEYRKHFVEDEVYYGLCSVVVYWAVNIPCMAFGGSLACGPIASGAEFLFARTIGPKLSDFVYNKANNGEQKTR